MNRFSFRTATVIQRVLFLLNISVILGLSVFITPSTSSAFLQKTSVTVMSRNLYVGADIFRIIEAANNPVNGELSVPLAVAEVFQTIQATNFPERAAAIADEIKRYRPHLVGLQEVSTILQQVPGDFLNGNPTPADDVVYDYEQILLRALAARNLPYAVAVKVTNADVELPLFAGLDENGNPLLNDIRLVDRDIILVRKDVAYTNPVARNFSTNLSLPIVGSPFEFTRGYTAVDARVKGLNLKFVNTHLEVGEDVGAAFLAVQSAQMDELLQTLDGTDKNLILLGDFNSAPDASAGSGEIITAYNQAIAAGYIDLGTRSRKTPELTCCFNESLDDPLAGLYERIDHIFLLPQDSKARFKSKFKTFGDRRQDLTCSGLWPSDHAGVVARIRF